MSSRSRNSSAMDAHSSPPFHSDAASWVDTFDNNLRGQTPFFIVEGGKTGRSELVKWIVDNGGRASPLAQAGLDGLGGLVSLNAFAMRKYGPPRGWLAKGMTPMQLFMDGWMTLVLIVGEYDYFPRDEAALDEEDYEHKLALANAAMESLLAEEQKENKGSKAPSKKAAKKARQKARAAASTAATETGTIPAAEEEAPAAQGVVSKKMAPNEAAPAEAAPPPPAATPALPPEPPPERPEPPDAFHCSITTELMDDPVIAFDGHTYERLAIERWLERRRTSPKTGEALENTVHPCSFPTTPCAAKSSSGAKGTSHGTSSRTRISDRP